MAPEHGQIVVHFPIGYPVPDPRRKLKIKWPLFRWIEMRIASDPDRGSRVEDLVQFGLFIIGHFVGKVDLSHGQRFVT